jgi:transaldolase
MTLYLDSASVADARRASELGFVGGVTTNPTLLTAVGRPAEEVIPALCDLLPGIVFHQLTAPDTSARAEEAHRIAGLRPGRIGLKIPCTLENLALSARLSEQGLIVGVTAIFSAAQAMLAAAAGARFVLPYVNRSTRLQGDGTQLVREMRAVIDAGRFSTTIIAASIKTPEEAVATVLAGSHHLTLPLATIEAMGGHALSDQAIAAFDRSRRTAGVDS